MADSLKDELAAKQAAAPTATTTPASATASSVAESGTVSMPAYADPARVDAINNMYNANINAQKANLQTSYDQNMSNLEANRESIAKRYQTQRNAAATDYERQRRNFNEQAMTNGLATGVGSQAQLAQNAAYQKQQGQISAAEGTDTSNLERSIADLKVKYQNDINTAVAENDYKRAAAMLDEYNNAYSMAMQKAQSLAQYGDFSGYADIYGQDAANQMGEVWAIQNPLVAYSLGRISAAKYYSITGKFPPGYSSGGGSSRSGGSSWSGNYTPSPENNNNNGGSTLIDQAREAIAADKDVQAGLKNGTISYAEVLSAVSGKPLPAPTPIQSALGLVPGGTVSSMVNNAISSARSAGTSGASTGNPVISSPGIVGAQANAVSAAKTTNTNKTASTNKTTSDHSKYYNVR